MSKPALHAVPHHRTSDRLRDDEADPGRLVATHLEGVQHERRAGCTAALPNDPGEVGGAPQPMCTGQHGRAWSGGQAGATLAPTRGQDRAAGTRAHPQTEAVRFRAPTIVGLERALAHGTNSEGQVGGQPGQTGGPGFRNHRPSKGIYRQINELTLSGLWTCGACRRRSRPINGTRSPAARSNRPSADPPWAKLPRMARTND